MGIGARWEGFQIRRSNSKREQRRSGYRWRSVQKDGDDKGDVERKKKRKRSWESGRFSLVIYPWWATVSRRTTPGTELKRMTGMTSMTSSWYLVNGRRQKGDWHRDRHWRCDRSGRGDFLSQIGRKAPAETGEAREDWI